MRSFSRRMTAAAAVLTLALPALASAALVSFTTAGAFSTTGGTTGVSSASGNVLTLSGGGGTLTFNGANQSFLIPDGGGAIGLPSGGFGTFAFAGPANTANFNNVNFSLTITQTSPTNGGTSFPSSIVNGTLFGSNGNLTLIFADPTSKVIGNVMYNVSSPQNNVGANIGLNGSVAVAPLPAPVAIGAATMGLVGWARRKRKAKDASAA